MSSLWIVVIGVVVIYAAYNFYARRIDRTVIQADPNKATPARMYMDGADFMPTSRFVLYGYHFKSIAAAGPIVGVITAANLWGWLPSILWLMIGVSFIGWASDYSAIMMAVRNDGNSLSAIAHRLISPRTRRILFVFIFFYLLLIAGAFVGIMAAIVASRPDVPFGIIVLALMGLFAGYAIYRMRMSIIGVTVLTVGLTVAAMAFGPFGATFESGKPTNWATAPIAGAFNSLTTSINTAPIYTVIDPTFADPRIPPADKEGKRPTTAAYNAETGEINVLPSFLLAALLLLVFSYVGANTAIWRFAQPVNYIGFWITAIVIGISALGAVLAPFTNPGVAAFKLDAAKGFMGATAVGIQPLWPMLFVTIACGAISGWHALFGSVGTARQLEYETDALPVGGGGMFSENTLGLLSLTAVAIAGGAGAGAFAGGVGNLINVASFGAIGVPFGTALGFGAFVVIVLTVVQLVFRVMRVTLGEWLGDSWVGFKNQHVASVVGMAVTMGLVLSGTWVYLWQLFGAANQLMAALSLLLVTVWLRSVGKNPAFAGIPMLFMYVTTMAATVVTAYNLFVTIATKPGQAAISVVGAWAMIAVSILLLVASALIAWDAWQAWKRYGGAPAPEPIPAASS
ncbi:MAG TPA: carbon starvation CstA family protein [Candidatus Limnocylindrales bacterium]|jgi:carbon starvation protein|nr:carbon starvation CstA family protein [Candidatus Limnocylindrales bacterium]